MSTVGVFTVDAPLALLGPQLRTAESHREWTNTCAILFKTLVNPINAANGARTRKVSGGNLSRMSVVPTACTIRIMNPETLNSTSGSVYVGQIKTKEDLRDYVKSAATIADELVSFCGAKSYSAASLAVRPIEVSCVPVDMTDLSSFYEMNVSAQSEDITYADSSFGEYPAGLAPVFISNPNGVPLTVEVSMKFRVRHGIESPFHSAMPLRPPGSERDWYDGIKTVLEDGVHFVGQIAGVAGSIVSLMNNTPAAGNAAGMLMLT